MLGAQKAETRKTYIHMPDCSVGKRCWVSRYCSPDRGHRSTGTDRKCWVDWCPQSDSLDTLWANDETLDEHQLPPICRQSTHPPVHQWMCKHVFSNGFLLNEWNLKKYKKKQNNIIILLITSIAAFVLDHYGNCYE